MIDRSFRRHLANRAFKRKKALYLNSRGWLKTSDEDIDRAVRKRWPLHCRCDYCVHPYKRAPKIKYNDWILE